MSISKSKIAALFLSAVLAGTAIGLVACSTAEKEPAESSSSAIETEESSTLDTNEGLETAYYGCPNSNRIRKLFTKKKKVC